MYVETQEEMTARVLELNALSESKPDALSEYLNDFFNFNQENSNGSK